MKTKLQNLIEQVNWHYDEYRKYSNALFYKFPENFVQGEDFECMLHEYFINRQWDNSATWKRLRLHKQDILHRSMEAFRKITDVIVMDDGIVIEFDFAIDDLVEPYEALETVGEDWGKFIVKYPMINTKVLEKELDMLQLLELHIKEIFKG